MFGFVCVFSVVHFVYFFFWRCVHFFTWFVRIIIKDGANSSERTKRVRAIIIKRVFVDFALVASCTRNHNQKLPEKHFRGYNCYGPGIFFILRSCRFKFHFFSRFILLCAASLHLIKMKMYKTSKFLAAFGRTISLHFSPTVKHPPAKKRAQAYSLPW